MREGGIFSKLLNNQKFPLRSPEGKYERKEAISDAERVSEIVFWAFQIGQGQHEVQRKAYGAMIANDPSLAEAVIRYSKSAPEEFVGEPYFDATLKKVHQFTGSKAHAVSMTDTSGKTNLTAEYRALVEQAFFYREGPNVRDEAFRELLIELMVRDTHYIAEAMRSASIPVTDSTPTESDVARNRRMQMRRKQGGSFIMFYALSDERQKHRAHLPPELQRLWEDMGLWIRANYKHLGPGDKNDLQNFKRIYQNLTNEKISLG